MASGLYMLIFDAVYGSGILSLQLFTLGNIILAMSNNYNKNWV